MCDTKKKLKQGNIVSNIKISKVKVNGLQINSI